MRRVKLKDIEGLQQPENMDAAGLSKAFGNLAILLQNVEELATRVDTLERDQKYTWEAIEKVQAVTDGLDKLAGKLKQYTVDHDELHRNMSKATGDSQKELMKLIRNVVAQTDIVQNAVKEMVKRELAVNVRLDAPPINIDVPTPPERPVEVVMERGEWEFDLKRTNNGLLDKVKAKPV
jgi:vacuolar-type H+-ATPase subunit I/STV1